MFIPLVLALGSIPFRIQLDKIPDVNKPREQAGRLTGAGARIIHAQNNSWEALLLFAVTLFIAYQTGVESELITIPSIAYVVIRLIYIIFYLLNLGWLRFATFVTGLMSLIWILTIAL
jgi:uncharacterized MAPEG superfamily protein